MTELRNTWALREVYFDEHGNPSMHREPAPMTDEPVKVCGLPSGMATSQNDGKWRVLLEFDTESDAKALQAYMTDNDVPAKSMTHPAPGVPDGDELLTGPQKLQQINKRFMSKLAKAFDDAAIAKAGGEA